MKFKFFLTTSLFLLLLLWFSTTANSRTLLGTLSSEEGQLVSDGVDVDKDFSSSFSNDSIIRIGRRHEDNGLAKECEQMYGFLPCTKTTGGHVFLIVVYEYLLFRAESFLASGGERVFKILGPGVFGASAFQVIGSLPESLILLASGLSSSSHETAQECVLTGVGLLAGSSIFLLTIVWGTCLILGAHPFTPQFDSNLASKHNNTPLDKFLFSIWPGYGVITDLHTSYTCRIMLLSVIPLLIIQIPSAFHLNQAGERILLLLTLTISIAFLICYFFYQFFQPWIQKRRLQYIKHEHLVVDILKHVQNQTMGKLLTDNGSPNVSTIRRLFLARDHNGDRVITYAELREFLEEIQFRKLNADMDTTTGEIMKEFDINHDDKITLNEFVDGMKKWLDDTKNSMNKRYHSVKSLKNIYQVLRPWIQKKREEREMMRHLIPDILEHLQNPAYGSLLAEDGSPDVPAIKRLFKEIDLDHDNCISCSELKQLITNIKHGRIPYNSDVAAAKLMEELDINRDQMINEEEFITGLSRWLSTMHEHDARSEESDEEEYQKTWEQTDKLVEHKFIDKSLFAWVKAIALLVLGIITLGLLAEPLIQSVRGLSRAAGLPSFYVAFVFIPLATTARLAVSAVKESRKKKMRTTSLTLSEIYGTVFMNNVLGLVVLLSLIYFRGLSWEFSVEVLMVLVVSTIIGGLASLTTVFPVWTSFLAYVLYPLSLVLVYILGGSVWLSS